MTAYQNPRFTVACAPASPGSDFANRWAQTFGLRPIAAPGPAQEAERCRICGAAHDSLRVQASGGMRAVDVRAGQCSMCAEAVEMDGEAMMPVGEGKYS